MRIIQVSWIGEAMNSNFNRQFVLIDLKLARTKEYLQFLGSVVGTYMLLRSYIYRSSKPHPNGLHKLYTAKKQLACYMEHDEIVKKTGFSRRTVISSVAKLVEMGAVKTISTGRGNIYLLGEYFLIKNKHGKISKFEWFCIDQEFGVEPPDSNLDEAEENEPSGDFTPDVQETAHQVSNRETFRSSDVQEVAHHNINIINKQINKKSNNRIYKIPVLKQPQGKIEYLADELVEVLNNPKARKYYLLVASRIPEPIIRQHLAEVKADNPKNPVTLFTHRMQKYADDYLDSQTQASNKSKVDELKQSLVKSMHPV